MSKRQEKGITLEIPRREFTRCEADYFYGKDFPAFHREVSRVRQSVERRQDTVQGIWNNWRKTNRMDGAVLPYKKDNFDLALESISHRVKLPVVVVKRLIHVA